MEPSTSPDLLIETRGEVAYLTLNRPAKRNALSRQLLQALASAQEQIAADRRSRVVVLAAQGSVFSAGHDLAEMVGCSEQSYRELFVLCSRVMYRFRQMPQPVIARVQGVATAAGCQLVAACDLVVASEHASFATPGVKIGLFCTTPMVPLVRTIAPRAALEMLLTGKPISAQRALALGLVNRVVLAAELDTSLRELTDAILASSPKVIALGKAAFYDQLALDEATAYEKANEVMTGNAICADAQEGIQAFLHKRRPVWVGTETGGS
jgi:enoyl-CoA hydratase/carnithine racemase